MDTAKDARILVMEDALRRINDIIGNRKLKIHVEYSKLVDLLKQTGSLFYEVKYSYASADQVADLEPTKRIIEYISEFEEIVEHAIKSAGYRPATPKETHTLAELSYSFRIVQGIQNRLKLYDDDPAHAVDLLAVEISQIQPIPDSKHLTECRCTDGSRIWRVVTNIQGLKTNTILPCAILPPIDMMNIVSEAMFLDETPLPDSTEPGILKNPLPPVLDQARAQVLHITKRMT